jgi:cyclopropane fatty-acyl-phospholipid synthase-like methyltransferase
VSDSYKGAVSDAAGFFNNFAEAFDTLYDGKRNAVMRWVDRQFRSDMFVRFALTFEVLGDLTGRTVLDVGCGSGPYVVEALRRGARSVTGVDPAPNMLALTRERTRAAGFSERCALVAGSFPMVLVPHDHAIVMGVMDYIEDAAGFLAALHPLVQRTAAVSFPSRHWFRTPIRQFRYRLRRCPVYFYDEGEIRRLALSAGFSGAQIQKIPGAGMDFHVCLSH